jgi:hypothetical protein
VRWLYYNPGYSTNYATDRRTPKRTADCQEVF